MKMILILGIMAVIFASSAFADTQMVILDSGDSGNVISSINNANGGTSPSQLGHDGNHYISANAQLSCRIDGNGNTQACLVTILPNQTSN